MDIALAAGGLSRLFVRGREGGPGDAGLGLGEWRVRRGQGAGIGLAGLGGAAEGAERLGPVELHRPVPRQGRRRGIEFDIERATQATLATLRANGHRDAYIRPLAWMGTGTIGLDVDPLSQHLMIATMAKVVHLGGARTRLTVSPWKRNPATSLPPLKLSGAYVNSILAKREAKQRGFDEALFTDDKGYVVECTGANVFIVKDGVLTAVEHPDALPGITRDTMMEHNIRVPYPIRGITVVMSLGS
mgnify:CR=1 FL=1